MLVPCFRPVSHGRIKTTRPVSWDVVQRGGGTGDVGGVCWCIGACLVGAIGRVRGDWSWEAKPAHLVPFLATDESAPANLRFENVPLVHFGGDILQVWGSGVGGREQFGCNSVVGWCWVCLEATGLRL